MLLYSSRFAARSLVVKSITVRFLNNIMINVTNVILVPKFNYTGLYVIREKRGFLGSFLKSFIFYFECLLDLGFPVVFVETNGSDGQKYSDHLPFGIVICSQVMFYQKPCVFARHSKYNEWKVKGLDIFILLRISEAFQRSRLWGPDRHRGSRVQNSRDPYYYLQGDRVTLQPLLRKNKKSKCRISERPRRALTI